MKRHFSVQVGDFAYTWWSDRVLEAAIVDADGNVIVEDTFQFDTDGEDADTPLTEMEEYAEAELRKRIKGGKEKMSAVHLHPRRTETDYVYERDDSLLVSDIKAEIAKNEEGPRVRKLDNGIRVYTRNSADPSRSFNGGDYDFYVNFIVDLDGRVIAFEGWSAEFDYPWVDTAIYGVHTVAELHAIAESF